MQPIFKCSVELHGEGSYISQTYGLIRPCTLAGQFSTQLRW